MAAIGSLVFCTDCGNLLDNSEGEQQAVLVCDVCGASNKGMLNQSSYFKALTPVRGACEYMFSRVVNTRGANFISLELYQSAGLELTALSDTSSKTLITRSKPTAFPSTLRQRLTSNTQTISGSERDAQSKDAMVARQCEKCGREEVRYYVQQLRSADEGSTVFYHCECGRK